MKTKTLKRLLIFTVIVAVVEFLKTNTIDGLCFSPVLPLLLMLDEWDPQSWAQRKLRER